MFTDMGRAFGARSVVEGVSSVGGGKRGKEKSGFGTTSIRGATMGIAAGVSMAPTLWEYLCWVCMTSVIVEKRGELGRLKGGGLIVQE
jgi:hypothetical protein